ncbi:hypothetical protein ACQYWY_07015 [Comamonas sediminis]|uniref:hypothetical protein n=1 Tax=Comamonas sediminis TaxID=1783360 RepID=UPI003D2DE3DD
MPFQLTEPTKVTIVNANPRRELHGEEKVRAIDIAFVITGSNDLLDLLEPGLREHHFCNKAAQAGQVELPDIAIPLPNIRHPQLPLAYHYAKGQKWRGYRFIWDWGTEGEHVDFTDAVLCGLQYELVEGGSVTIKGTIQYNGDELQDNDTFGELSGLAAEGEIYIKLLAPAEVMLAKKGYRAGKPDTPSSGSDSDDGGQQDLVGLDSDGEGLTPEKAFANSLEDDSPI